MLKSIVRPEVSDSPEFQSAVIRLMAWLLMMTYLAAAAMHGVYHFDWRWFGLLFGVHFVWYSSLLLHVVSNPRVLPGRTYLGMVADISGNAFAIYLAGNAVTPFVLIFVWIFLSQGTRYGSRNLAIAAVLSVFSYAVDATALGGWRKQPFEVGFILFFLIILPLYHYALLRRLHRTRQAAEEASRARGNFLATMTHELRTPLSGVIGMAGLLKETQLDHEQQGYVDAINISAGVLQSLIGDILDLSKIDAGKLELRKSHFDIRQSVMEVCRVLGSQALDRRLELICRIHPDVPARVFGDDLRFRQVLFNLLGNALKFTEQGEVMVEVAVVGNGGLVSGPSLEVAVKDTGIGIPKAEMSRIFDSFWQADDSTTRRHGGSGLGTTIARDLTRLMGGNIGVESEEGRGSRFWVRLPLIDRSRADPPKAPAILAGHRVLCIESNASMALAIREALVAAGMEVLMLEGVDAVSGLPETRRAGLDLVILSDTPSGIDLCGEAQRLRQRLGHPVPMVLGHYPRRGLHMGDTRSVFLDKPFGPKELWDACAEALAPVTSRHEAGRTVEHRHRESCEESGLHVLVAEDDNVNAQLIHSLLTRKGHRVTLMRDGEAALQAAMGCDFDLALIDLRMPKRDGLDFTRSWRAHESAVGAERRLPIIALTANVAEEARDACLDAGMDDFLTKPVDPETLDGLIARYTAKRS
ncbi:MAG: response regulator [Gammaproteobacteria bacterium]|nr:MAG: response regulator [Gammaproteobacteria bacterium]